MTIHERFGLLQERYENEVEQHRSTIDMIQRIQKGEHSLDQLVIMHNPDGTVGWMITPKAAMPTPEAKPGAA